MVKTMRAMMKRFYSHGARGIFRHGKFTIANWFGNIEFQITRGNQPIVKCCIVDGCAVIEKLSDDADEYMPTILSVVSEHHNIA